MKDDKEVEKFLIKEYFYIHKIGLAYASWDKGSAIISVIQYAIYFFVTCFTSALLFYTAYLTTSDIALFSQSLHMSLVHIFCLTNIINNSIVYRKLMIEIHRQLMKGLCNYENGEFYEGEKAKIFKEKKILLLMVPLYYAFCGLSAFIVGPILDGYYGVDAQAFDPQISLKLPFAMWTPFDVDNNLIIFIAMSSLQVLMIFTDAICISAGVAMYVVVVNYLCLHLKLLINSFDNLDIRAHELYKVRHGNASLSKINKLLYNKYYNECLKENIKHHQSICRLHKMYFKLSGIPIFVPMIAGALLLAMAIVHFLSDDERVGSKLTSGVIVFGEMLNLLLMCIYGEKAKQLSEDVREAIYSIKWYDMDKECHSTVSIFQHKTIEPMNVRCGYILHINMETFGAIINSTYSYINLVYALK